MKRLMIIILALVISTPVYSVGEATFGTAKFGQSAYGTNWDLKYIEHKSSMDFDRINVGGSTRYTLKHRISISNHISNPPKLTNYYEVLTEGNGDISRGGLVMGVEFKPDRHFNFDLGMAAKGEVGLYLKGGVDYIW